MDGSEEKQEEENEKSLEVIESIIDILEGHMFQLYLMKLMTLN